VGTPKRIIMATNKTSYIQKKVKKPIQKKAKKPIQKKTTQKKTVTRKKGK
jgi:hypothetical protein